MVGSTCSFVFQLVHGTTRVFVLYPAADPTPKLKNGVGVLYVYDYDDDDDDDFEEDERKKAGGEKQAASSSPICSTESQTIQLLRPKLARR